MIGTPVTFPELAAAMLGTCPTINDGLLITTVGAVEAWVIIEDVELERAGDEGRWLTNDAAGGEAAVMELVESRCLWCDPLGKGDGGANTDVGVGTGVF